MTSTAGPTPISARWRSASPRPRDERGIGLTLLPSFYAHGGFGGARPPPGSAASSAIPIGFSTWSNASSRRSSAGLPAARVGIAPHSLRAVTPRELRASARGAPDGPIHIHAAEQVREVEDCVACAWPSSGGMAARERRARSALVPDPCDPRDRSGDNRAGGVAERWSASARSRRPISATAFSTARPISRPGGVSASGPIPTSRSTPRPNCGSSSTASVCCGAPAMS